jgi:hypothetical protein
MTITKIKTKQLRNETDTRDRTREIDEQRAHTHTNLLVLYRSDRCVCVCVCDDFFDMCAFGCVAGHAYTSEHNPHREYGLVDGNSRMRDYMYFCVQYFVSTRFSC